MIINDTEMCLMVINVQRYKRRLIFSTADFSVFSINPEQIVDSDKVLRNTQIESHILWQTVNKFGMLKLSINSFVI